MRTSSGYDCDSYSICFWTDSKNDSVKNDPIAQTLLLCLGFTLLVQMVSTATRNYSQVDKLWSILPPMYAIVLAKSPRGILMAFLAVLWGIRLTYNFHRRGGYRFPCIWQGEEDYRWSYIRKGGFLKILTDPLAWELFNLGFISIYQNILLWWIAAPSIIVYIQDVDECRDTISTNAITFKDWILAACFLILLAIETMADNQQYHFQNEKYRQRAQSPTTICGAYRDGFCQSGLFAVCRKPNYAAEQAMWLVYYCFSVINDTRFWNWSLLGWIQLAILFQSSGWLTEKITAEKYPAYTHYQQQVPLYVPFAKGFRVHTKD